MSSGNARRTNGHRRTQLRTWLMSQGRTCWICRAFGRRGTIDYSLPPGHPYSFEVDELVPVSLGGDPLDPNNVDAAHRICNQWRSNKTVEQVLTIARQSKQTGSCGHHSAPRQHGAPRKGTRGTTSTEW